MPTVSNVLLLVAFLSASGGAGAAGSDARPPARAGEVIVTFKGRVELAAMQSTAVRGHAEARVARTLASVGKPQMVLVRFPEGVPVEEMVARHRIVLTDFGNNWLLNSRPLTRIWTSGKIIGEVAAFTGDTTTNDCTYSGGGNTCSVFWVGDLSGTGVFTPKAIYGTPSDGSAGVLPYLAARGGGPGAGPKP